VAFYGEKSDLLAAFVRWIQALVAEHVGEGFRPYEIGQVHATIVGLEGHRRNGEILNEQYWQHGQTRPMDIAGLLDTLLQSGRLPFRVRIGGFQREHRYSFESFGRHPYLRSFEIQASTIVVAMGWPVNADEYSPTLDGLRRDLNRHNILHKYHRTSDAIDNDFYFVLGKLDSGASAAADLGAVADAIRARMANTDPLTLDVTTRDLSLVAYSDNELPLRTSVRFPIEMARSAVEELTSVFRSAT